jgi:uncharacterized protein YcfL
MKKLSFITLFASVLLLTGCMNTEKTEVVTDETNVMDMNEPEMGTTSAQPTPVEVVEANGSDQMPAVESVEVQAVEVPTGSTENQ